MKRLSYLGIIHSLGGPFFFGGLVNVCIICLSPLQGQKWLPHGWPREMFLEAFLVILGKPGHGFTIKGPNESCSLILTTPAKVPSISLHLANAELSLSPLQTVLESDTNPCKRIICFMDEQLTTDLKYSISGRASYFECLGLLGLPSTGSNVLLIKI